MSAAPHPSRSRRTSPLRGSPGPSPSRPTWLLRFAPPLRRPLLSSLPRHPILPNSLLSPPTLPSPPSKPHHVLLRAPRAVRALPTVPAPAHPGLPALNANSVLLDILDLPASTRAVSRLAHVQRERVEAMGVVLVILVGPTPSLRPGRTRPSVAFARRDSSWVRLGSVKSALKDVPVARLQPASAQPVKQDSRPTQTTAPAAFPLLLPLLLAPTANSSMSQLVLVSPAPLCAKRAQARSRRSALRVAPASLWVLVGGASQSMLKACVRVRNLLQITPRGSVMPARRRVHLVRSLRSRLFPPRPRSHARLALLVSYSRLKENAFQRVRPERFSCAECAGSSTFCTACASGGALNGKCVSTCPGGTFLSQSNTPPSSNSTTVRGSTCLNYPKTVDASPRPRVALKPILIARLGRAPGATGRARVALERVEECAGGRCVTVECANGASTVFGVCLSELVTALPPQPRPNTGGALQIALGATGGLSLLVLGLLAWRRRARSRRAKGTAAFADTLPDTRNKRWDWGKVWRMGETQRKREQGWFSGLGCGGRKGKEFHREMSLRRLNSGKSVPAWRNRRTANMSVDQDWRNVEHGRDWRSSDAESSVVFNRAVPLPPFSDRDSMDSRREEFWRDSIDENKVRAQPQPGAFGGINPESHFARTLAAARASPVSREDTPTPVPAPLVKSITPNPTGAKSVTPDVTGVSAHTFGSPSTLVNLTDSSSVSRHQTGASVAQSTGSSMYMHGGGKWMVPDLTGMSSVPSHYTGMSGTSTSLASHYTGMSMAPRAPLPYAPFLSASTSTSVVPQPRQPLRDNTTQGPFAINTSLGPTHNTSMLMTPPPHALPSSPVWPGAVGGSYWFSEEQQQQALAQQAKLGDKNPFRRF
ncbi:hypothetical protein FRC10_008279 [Ceratobasidium sp. 414]|nr:hypothetical protein FRC10_008279 [Ceratobasidium sp. 414]